MKKYILITLIPFIFISACSDVKEDTSQNVIPSTLLQPVRMDGSPILDQAVLDGRKADEVSGFDWPWGQHNAKILKKE